MSRNRFSPVFALAVLFAPPAFAQEDPAIQIRQEQRLQQRVDDTRPPARSSAASTEPGLTVVPGDIAEPIAWITSPAIAIVGNVAIVDGGAIADIVAPYRSLPLGERRLTLLIRQINAQLVRQGLVTSRARIVRMDRAANRIDIEIVAGTIGTMTRDGEALDEGMAGAFPRRDGDVLVLSDLEQGIHQIQRLRMYQAEMRILPGQSPGASQIDLSLVQDKPWWLQFSLDNQGSDATGKHRARATLALENTLGLLDLVSATYVRSRDSDALLVAGSIPMGYDTWSISHAVSRYRQSLPAGLQQRGGSSSATIAWNRVLHLSAEGRDSADLSLSYSDAWRRIAGVSLTPERLTVIRGTLARVRQGAGWRAWGEGGAVIGLPWFGAIEDARLDRAAPHARFAKLELHGGVTLTLAGTGWQYTGQADMQHSRVGLYGPEQFRIGGMTTVRGYDEGLVVGDRGYVMRHELHAPPRQATEVQAQLAPFGFLDHGHAAYVGADSRRLAATGIGLRLRTRRLGADAVLAKPVDSPSTIAPNHWRLHFTLRIDL